MDAITVTTVPAAIDTNFAAIKAQLSKDLEDYDVVVTVDTVKEAKSRATELNKLSGEIDSRRKAEVSKAAEPIKAFETQAKELTTMCQDVRQRILAQVKVFESVTLAKVAELLIEYRDTLYEKHKVREEFQRVDVTGWEKLSWLTSTENLTAAAKKEVDTAVGEFSLQQGTTDLRISRLENESHRVGLHSPLTREHVEGILFAPDEQYIGGLQKLVARELQRQEETERKAREKLEREQREQAEAEEDRKSTLKDPGAMGSYGEGMANQVQEQDLPAPTEEPKATQQAPATGKKIIQVELLLHVDVDQFVSPEVVQGQLLKKLAAAGIDKTITSCRATEVSVAA